jgi:hypothetical protein
MSTRTRGIVIAAVAVLAVLVVGGALTINSRAAARTSPEGVNLLTQIKNENAVTVEVTPLNITGSGPTLDFRVALNAHSGDLNYDLTKVVVLRDSRNNEYVPAGWAGSNGGHHIEGVLKFSNRADILKSGVKSLSLELKGIAQVPSRQFQWNVGQ